MGGMITDIRQYKKELRLHYRTLRKEMSPQEKREKDDGIFRRLVDSPDVKNAGTILCFVSTLIEIDTHRLIYYALRHGKKVAVPRCLDDKGSMAFFVIRSMADLERGAFQLLEPSLQRCPKLTDFRRSVCIVPGFSFDDQGFRLGYGKGYYDRFLSRYPGVKIGICYENCIAEKLPHGRYDVPVDYLITEQHVRTIKPSRTRTGFVRRNR
ncbi:MAG: 5-formyltetrahydrofolate cyclo-ligase [Massiliimalia sp.]|jgi:5-formyltetrahydrofolate cyclo-ligase